MHASKKAGLSAAFCPAVENRSRRCISSRVTLGCIEPTLAIFA